MVLAVLAITAIGFPYHVDAPPSAAELEKSRQFYADAYRQNAGESQPSKYETRYIQVAAGAAQKNRIREDLETLVDRYGLRHRRVLEIGSGRGYLQDVAHDYTGLDISPTVGRFYHKKFVLGSATALPFSDNSFDGAWSVWVLEHVPNPEQAFLELRRVMRDGGVILLVPAWNCTAWAAEGYRVRPYSEFGLTGKLIKAMAPVRFSIPYQLSDVVPARMIRKAASLAGGPTRLHYTRLTPNYQHYWEADSDAVNSIDRHEAMLWFQSRGDECLNCAGPVGSIFMTPDPWLIVRIHKER
jgi:SAM-dependent methyltransferase